MDSKQVENVLKWLLEDARGTVKGGKSNFSHVKDYRYIYPSFRQLYNIDLNKDDLSWWEYTMLLEGCMVNQCTLSHVIGVRCRALPKDPKQKEELLNLKHKYALTQKENGLGNMFKALEGVSKDAS